MSNWVEAPAVPWIKEAVRSVRSPNPASMMSGCGPERSSGRHEPDQSYSSKDTSSVTLSSKVSLTDTPKIPGVNGQ